MASPSSSTPTGASPDASQPQPTPSSSSSPVKPPALLTNDPARTGYDPSIAWWMNYFRFLTGKITPEGAFHYREDRYRIHEERDCKRCEEYRDWLFTYSPVVRFMRSEITKLNGELDASNVVCRRCPARLTEDGNVVRQSGGFSPDHGILLCANEIRNRGHLEDSLTHEMVHAWDHLRWKVDFLGEKDLRQAACAEIRASTLSGECRWTRETMTRGNWNLTQQFQNCVRKRAVQSVMARPKCRDDVHAVKVVNEVWDSCFNDTRPFNEVFR